MGDVLISILLLVGALFSLLGSIGLARLPDIYSRLHGPTKSTTLGLGALLLASVVHFNLADGELKFAELLIALFVTITAPVSAYLLARAAQHRGNKTDG